MMKIDYFGVIVGINLQNKLYYLGFFVFPLKWIDTNSFFYLNVAFRCNYLYHPSLLPSIFSYLQESEDCMKEKLKKQSP